MLANLKIIAKLFFPFLRDLVEIFDQEKGGVGWQSRDVVPLRHSREEANWKNRTKISHSFVFLETVWSYVLDVQYEYIAMQRPLVQNARQTWTEIMYKVLYWYCALVQWARTPFGYWIRTGEKYNSFRIHLTKLRKRQLKRYSIGDKVLQRNFGSETRRKNSCL